MKIIEVTEQNHGQRIDNLLIKTLKGVPKSLFYRLMRKGSIRVNKKRIKPEYKLVNEDILRIAPIRVSENTTTVSTQLNVVAKHALGLPE